MLWLVLVCPGFCCGCSPASPCPQRRFGVLSVSRQGRRPSAAACRAGASAPGPPDAIGAAFECFGAAPVLLWWEAEVYRSIEAFWGGGSSGMGCSGVPQCRPPGRHWGAQRIRDVGSATLLRLVAPPEVTATHRLIARADAVWIPAAVPVRFREPMGGESGDGGYGGTGFRECGDAVGCKNSVGWVADSAPGALPPDPRQGLLAPGPPPRGDGPPWNRHPR